MDRFANVKRGSLEHTKVVIYSGIFWLIFIAGFLLSKNAAAKSNFPMVTKIIPCLTLLTVVVCVVMLGHKVVADTEGIHQQFFAWQQKNFRWDEVAKISLFQTGPGMTETSGPRSGMVFENLGGEKLSVDFSEEGWRNFASVCLQHLPSTVMLNSPEAVATLQTFAVDSEKGSKGQSF